MSDPITCRSCSYSTFECSHDVRPARPVARDNPSCAADPGADSPTSGEAVGRENAGALGGGSDLIGLQLAGRSSRRVGATTVHRFEVVAKALNGYRHQLVVCVHQKQFVYPVLVLSGRTFDDGDGSLAASQDEFTRSLKEILNSKQTIGLIHSLLARLGETGTATVPAQVL